MQSSHSQHTLRALGAEFALSAHSEGTGCRVRTLSTLWERYQQSPSKRRKSKRAGIYLTKVAQGKGLNQDSNLELRFQSLYFAISKGQLIPEKKKKKKSSKESI